MPAKQGHASLGRFFSASLKQGLRQMPAQEKIRYRQPLAGLPEFSANLIRREIRELWTIFKKLDCECGHKCTCSGNRASKRELYCSLFFIYCLDPIEYIERFLNDHSR